MSDLAVFRSTKDHLVRHDPQSPLTGAQRATFTGLSYFNEDPSLRFTLQIQPFPEQDNIEMQTTTGQNEKLKQGTSQKWVRMKFNSDLYSWVADQTAISAPRNPLAQPPIQPGPR